MWRWCGRTAGGAGLYQYLDNQALADVIAGRFPASSEVERGGVRFRVRDEVSQDRLATIDGLRREIPADRIEDIVVESKSWNLID